MDRFSNYYINWPACACSRLVLQSRNPPGPRRASPPHSLPQKRTAGQHCCRLCSSSDRLWLATPTQRAERRWDTSLHLSPSNLSRCPPLLPSLLLWPWHINLHRASPCCSHQALPLHFFKSKTRNPMSGLWLKLFAAMTFFSAEIFLPKTGTLLLYWFWLTTQCKKKNISRN